MGSVDDDTTRSRLAFFADIAREPAFNILRTKEQLGYLIWSGQRSTTNTTGFRILLQSEKSASFIESRIESFFDYLFDVLSEMSNDRFESIRAGFISKHSALPQSLGDESFEYWTAIRDNHYDFERSEFLTRNDSGPSVDCICLQKLVMSLFSAPQRNNISSIYS